jgi:hypothetical protein
MSKPCQYEQDPSSPIHYAWVDLKSAEDLDGEEPYAPGVRTRVFHKLVGDEITPREALVLIKIMDQIEGAAFLRREWVQLTIEDWCRMLGGASSSTAKRVKSSLLEKGLIIERDPDLIREPEEHRVHGNVPAVQHQTPSQRERRRQIRSGEFHKPRTNGSQNGEASGKQEQQSNEAEGRSELSPEYPSWLPDDWRPPTQ